jgi:hypothetical protein
LPVEEESIAHRCLVKFKSIIAQIVRGGFWY